MKRYTHSPAHPDVVAGLADATALRGLSNRLETAIDELKTHPARQSLMDARVLINRAVRDLTP